MSNLAPSNEEHELDVYNANWNTNALKFVCIDRHKGGINAAFVDMSARHVGIKELYRLKWHKNFITSSLPGNGSTAGAGTWPAWTNKYKDY